MHAFRFIQGARKALENIDFVSMVGLAMHGSKREVEKAMERWARDADVPITFGD